MGVIGAPTGPPPPPSFASTCPEGLSHPSTPATVCARGGPSTTSVDLGGSGTPDSPPQSSPCAPTRLKTRGPVPRAQLGQSSPLPGAAGQGPRILFHPPSRRALAPAATLPPRREAGQEGLQLTFCFAQDAGAPPRLAKPFPPGSQERGLQRAVEGTQVLGGGRARTRAGRRTRGAPCPALRPHPRWKLPPPRRGALHLPALPASGDQRPPKPLASAGRG